MKRIFVFVILVVWVSKGFSFEEVFVTPVSREEYNMLRAKNYMTEALLSMPTRSGGMVDSLDSSLDSREYTDPLLEEKQRMQRMLVQKLIKEVMKASENLPAKQEKKIKEEEPAVKPSDLAVPSTAATCDETRALTLARGSDRCSSKMANGTVETENRDMKSSGSAIFKLIVFIAIVSGFFNIWNLIKKTRCGVTFGALFARWILILQNRKVKPKKNAMLNASKGGIMEICSRSVPCPYCGCELEIPTGLVAGQHLLCPYCERKFTLENH